MKLYLAGPMRGIPAFNFPAFEVGAARLRTMGHEVFSPAERDAAVGFDPSEMTGWEDLGAEGFSLRGALAADTAYIANHADAVVLLPNWEESKGVAAEIALARALSLPVVPLDTFLATSPESPAETSLLDYLIDAAADKAQPVSFKTFKEAEDYQESYMPTMAERKERTDRMIEGMRHGVAPKRVGNIIVDHPILGPGFSPFGSVHESQFVNAERMFASAADSLKAEREEKGPKPGDRVIQSGEVRTVSATGGEKGTKPQRYDLLPVHPLNVIAELYANGAAKYSAHNWRRGYVWSHSYAACMRHLTAFWDGEDIDPEMNTPHLASAAFHIFALLQFMRDFPEYDDRFKAPEATNGE